MNSYIRLIILITIIGINLSFKQNIPPSDFGFIVESATHKVSSFDCTYVRNYSEGDSIVKIQFSEVELKRIYNAILNNGLDKYPYNYSPTCEITQIPSFEAKLSFRLNGVIKNITYKYDCRYPKITGYFKNRKYSKINNVLKQIDKIVISKPEVRRLSDTNIIFL
jgi:hypothetical protein